MLPTDDHQDLEFADLHAHEGEDAARVYDSLAQQLFTIGVAAGLCRSSSDAARLAQALRDIEELAAEARRELRDTRPDRAPIALRTPFESELHSEARAIARRAACRVAVTRKGAPWALDGEVHRLLMDTAREVLRVAVGLQRARLAVAHVRYAADSVSLSVQAEDLWSGADSRPDLDDLRARARRLQGTLEESAGGDGAALVRLVIPSMPPATE